ncbi:conserved hypothetical protein [Theileria orientalis strain Shintoku]|uniref:Uncharacterized protein n=1 Tax=Theileria orientalis strain Shintoku TaxID=869250 RepID=J4C7E1_THEOR|nr:conserved hypothetical protein [Theileria orientalis strain Shintoku]BAM38878.1 conserved hypothetical protein [Theileria orientalis strain Shintoku]|eukprot:XP_009689179.1 conserved hypothetical protein [Theileria orientalis strain Shintoku]
MSNGDYLVDKIKVYYKIVTPEFPKSASESACTHSSYDSQGLHYEDRDSSNSDFMCTLVDCKNSLSVYDVLVNLSHVLCHSESVMFTKVLVPLDSLFPYPVNLDSLMKESNVTRSNYSKSYLGRSGTRPNIFDEHNNEVNRNNPSVESTTRGFNISNISKNFKIDTLMSRFSSLRSAEERKHTHLVWVYANLDEPIRVIDNKIYIKVYLSNKSYKRSNDTYTNIADFISTTTKYDSVIDTSFAAPITEAKTKVAIDEPLLPSDRDEINEMIDKWSLTSDGKLKDIQDVGWEPMPLSLLVGDKDSIKKYYKLYSLFIRIKSALKVLGIGFFQSS